MVANLLNLARDWHLKGSAGHSSIVGESCVSAQIVIWAHIIGQGVTSVQIQTQTWSKSSIC